MPTKSWLKGGLRLGWTARAGAGDDNDYERGNWNQQAGNVRPRPELARDRFAGRAPTMTGGELPGRGFDDLFGRLLMGPRCRKNMDGPWTRSLSDRCLHPFYDHERAGEGDLSLLLVVGRHCNSVVLIEGLPASLRSGLVCGDTSTAAKRVAWRGSRRPCSRREGTVRHQHREESTADNIVDGPSLLHTRRGRRWALLLVNMAGRVGPSRVRFSRRSVDAGMRSFESQYLI